MFMAVCETCKCVFRSDDAPGACCRKCKPTPPPEPCDPKPAPCPCLSDLPPNVVGMVQAIVFAQPGRKVIVIAIN